MPKKTGNTDRMIYRKPGRMFENSGTVYPEEFYYVPLDNVTNTRKQDIKTMIDQGRYFSIFAPRQSGKTTFFDEVEVPEDISTADYLLPGDRIGRNP